MKNTMFLGLLLLGACGQPQDTTSQNYPTEFSPYIEAFKDEAAAHGRVIPADRLSSMTMTYGDTSIVCGPKAIACCRSYLTGQRTIVIDQAWFNRSVAAVLYEGFFHEFGHCLLDQMTHRDGLDANGNPTSVLHSTVFDGKYFQAHINDYMDELFYFK